MLLLAVCSLSHAAAPTTTALVKFQITLRPGVTVKMGATVMAKAGGPRGHSLLVLNGTAQTAKTFTALARALLASDAGVSSLIFRLRPAMPPR
jgi:hypothetical protein